MANVLYRANGGQVLVVSDSPLTASYIPGTFDRAYYLVANNVSAPDGVDLSVPKIYDGSVVRNATAQEQTTFATAAAADATQQTRAQAILALRSDMVFRKVIGAVVDVMVQQLNILRTQPTTAFSALDKTAVKAVIEGRIADGSND
jgi:hypothetical protein